jgi:hypothetical protein
VEPGAGELATSFGLNVAGDSGVSGDAVEAGDAVPAAVEAGDDSGDSGEAVVEVGDAVPAAGEAGDDSGDSGDAVEVGDADVV